MQFLTLKSPFMTTKEYALLPLFEKFIQYSYKGKRLKPDGNRIKPQTVDNYQYVLRYLREYETEYGIELRIKVINSSNKRIFIAERNYWKKFYLQFTNFLYQRKNCYDNYVGTVIKTIRIFFNFLNKDIGISTGVFYKSFYVCREEVPIVTLLPGQLQFLINDAGFDEQLNRPLQKAKDIFVFGCTVALRVSDLFAIRFSDIERMGAHYYLPVKTIKTGTAVRIKLPAYAIAIIEKFSGTARGRKTIFPPIPRTRFNNQLKAIAELAGWVNDMGRLRTKRGVHFKNAGRSNNEVYRFCDLVSSHTMRRTAITTMLMLGMKEHVVRKISGHADNSKSFYRYVNLVQSYLDNEVDEVFGKLVQVA
jgi:integrase